MKTLLHRADSVLGSFSGAGVRDFVAGTIMEVSEEAAAYILEHYPDQFEPASKKSAKSASVAAPTKDASMKSPAKRKAPAKRKTAAKKGKA